MKKAKRPYWKHATSTTHTLQLPEASLSVRAYGLGFRWSVVFWGPNHAVEAISGWSSKADMAKRHALTAARVLS